MVGRAALLILAAFAVPLIACGGSDEPIKRRSGPEPTDGQTRGSSGPTTTVEPRSGPPGDFVTVSGVSWPPGELIDVTGVLPAGLSADPYATTTTDQSGAFSLRFRLETTPTGSDQQVGRFDLLVRSASSEVDVQFLVKTRRPIQNSGPGG